MSPPASLPPPTAPARPACASVFRDGLFAGEVHVVTGGGSGIGRRTALELSLLGADVALVGRKLDKLDVVAAELRAQRPDAVVKSFACDIREEDRVRETIAAIVGELGRIDGLVNNAGGQFAAPLAGISQKGFETVVRTNLTGGFLVARECFTTWMREHGGAIVNIVADMWGSMVGMGHSGAARAGMVSFTETAAVEWAASGVRVNAVAPGWIAGSGLETYPETIRRSFRLLRRAVPLQRLGTEAEVAAAICFLLSPAAAFVSGSVLRVDGAAPNARLASPLSSFVPGADAALAGGALPWPLVDGTRSTPAWDPSAPPAQASEPQRAGSDDGER